MSVVADLDGTSVEDEDYFDTLPNLSRLMLIRDGETWLFDPGEGKKLLYKYTLPRQMSIYKTFLNI